MKSKEEIYKQLDELGFLEMDYYKSNLESLKRSLFSVYGEIIEIIFNSDKYDEEILNIIFPIFRRIWGITHNYDDYLITADINVIFSDIYELCNEFYNEWMENYDNSCAYSTISKDAEFICFFGDGYGILLLYKLINKKINVKEEMNKMFLEIKNKNYKI